MRFQFIDGLSKVALNASRDVPPEILALEHRSLADFESRLERLYDQRKFTVTVRLILGDNFPKGVLFSQSEADVAKFAETRDGWGIFDRSVQPVGADIEFHFEEGKLVRMEYRRTRTSLEVLP